MGLCARAKLEESRADEDCEVKLVVLLSEGAAELTKDAPAVESGAAVCEVLSAEPVIEDDTAVSEVAMPAEMAAGDDQKYRGGEYSFADKAAYNRRVYRGHAALRIGIYQVGCSMPAPKGGRRTEHVERGPGF